MVRVFESLRLGRKFKCWYRHFLMYWTHSHSAVAIADPSVVAIATGSVLKERGPDAVSIMLSNFGDNVPHPMGDNI